MYHVDHRGLKEGVCLNLQAISMNNIYSGLEVDGTVHKSFYFY